LRAMVAISGAVAGGRSECRMDSARAKRISEELRGQFIGDWAVRSYIAHGKSAVVLKAEKSGQVAAIKVFDPELIETFGPEVQANRIQRELSLRGRLHDNLVQILDGGECSQKNLFFVVMEFLDWPTLATVLSDVPRERIWPLIAQVAGAARFLETLGLVHRDIKPDNIAISRDFRTAKLMDLGVLRPFGDSHWTDHDQRTFIGTLQYASPEVLFREEKDTAEGWRAVTFYQLGAVLHDMIMRKRILERFSGPFALLVEAVRKEIPRVAADDVPPDLVLLNNSPRL